MNSKEILLKVKDLQTSISFYNEVLCPLGYGIISRTRHELANETTLDTTFGPFNTNRVDLRLAQIEHLDPSNVGSLSRDRPRVEFTAPSTLAVRQFYTAATRWRVRPVNPPTPSTDSLFAVVEDPDGNKIEARYNGCSSPRPSGTVARQPVPREAPSEGTADTSIDKWRVGVADYCTPINGPPPAQPARRALSSTSTAETIKPARTIMKARDSQDASQLRDHYSAPQADGINARHVVAGAAAAAAGGALAYGVYRELSDSKEQERDFNRAVDRRKELEAEARSHARRADKPRRLADRDSGYYSTSSNTAHQEGGPSTNRRESTQHARVDNRSGRKSASPPKATKMIAPAAAPSYGSRRPSQPSTMDKRGHISVSQAPSKPSMLVSPSAYPRRHESRSTSRRPATPQLPTSRSDKSHTTVRRLTYPKSKEPAKLQTRTASKATTRAPMRPDSKGPSKPPSYRTAASNRTAHNAPLPASNIRTTSTHRTAGRKPSYATSSRSRARSALDDLATVAPSDSVSCR